MNKGVSLGGRIGWLWLLSWLGVVGAGLFVPLMDNDSAHHANIALRMFLTGDYVNLIDYDGPYLDKPHLHFWLSAASYHLFGVNGFAYKLPSFLFSLIGIWAVYRSGGLAINERAGRVAAVIYASSASFLLALNDVRMDAILCASVAISLWQFLGYFFTGRTQYVAGLSLGLALGFCTKGHIGVLIPILFAAGFAYFKKNWVPLFNWRVGLGVVLFFLFITPVVYCYYIQFNLHPELVVRGRSQIDGVKFILLDQSIGRYAGEMGGDARGDKLFFFHSFLWVFAPWSLVSLFSLFVGGWRGESSSVTKTSLFVLLVFGVLVGFSSFKLPHYLNVILPIAALWIAAFWQDHPVAFSQSMLWSERFMWVLLGLGAGLVLVWWFPEQPLFFWIGLMVFLVVLFYIHLKSFGGGLGIQTLRVSVVVLVLFWIMNAAFYRSLLEYQGGNKLGETLKEVGASEPVYSLRGCYSSSFYFTTRHLRKEVSPENVRGLRGYLLLDEKQKELILSAGVVWEKEWSVSDYEITRLSIQFLNPEKRKTACSRLILIRLSSP